MQSSAKLALTYFAIVFSAGFALGTIRTLWLEPAIGERYAELAEMPCMVAIFTIAAFKLVKRWHSQLSDRSAIAAGIGALILLLAFELTIVLGLRGESIPEYIASRDWIAGTAYLVSLCAFASMPAIALRRLTRDSVPNAPNSST